MAGLYSGAQRGAPSSALNKNFEKKECPRSSRKARASLALLPGPRPQLVKVQAILLRSGFEPLPSTSAGVDTPRPALIDVSENYGTNTVGALSGPTSPNDSNDRTIIANDVHGRIVNSQDRTSSRNSLGNSNSGGSSLIRNHSGGSSASESQMSARCFSDFRRQLRFLKREMLEASHEVWCASREEFYVRLADLEYELQNEIFPHIQELRNAGCPGKAEGVEIVVREFRKTIVELQALTDSECAPRGQHIEARDMRVRVNNGKGGGDELLAPNSGIGHQGTFREATVDSFHGQQDSFRYVSERNGTGPPPRTQPAANSRVEQIGPGDDYQRHCNDRVERAMGEGVYRSQRSNLAGSLRHHPNVNPGRSNLGARHDWQSGDVRQRDRDFGRSTGAMRAGPANRSYGHGHGEDFDQQRSGCFSFRAPGQAGGPRSMGW